MGRVAVEDWPALEALVARVERGEAVEITRGGATVARLEARDAQSTLREDMTAEEPMTALRRMRVGRSLGDVDISELLADSRT